MKGLNLSKLKKVSSDDKTTTFAHPDGHEIKIAHFALSQKMREELKNLPSQRENPKKMAVGGDTVKVNPPSDINPTEPQANPNQQDPGDKPYGLGDTLYGTNQPVQAPSPIADDQSIPDRTPADQTNSLPQQSEPAPAPQEPQAQPTPQNQEEEDETPEAAPAPVPQAPKNPITEPVTAQEAYDHLNDEANKLRSDFGTGQIPKETYHDLYAKKDTLGKIGTIFGLFLGGIGSGLTHQPNALLEMMNKEIDRDYDAQKATKTNQLTALNLAETHARNQSEIQLQKLQAQAIAAKTPAEKKLIESQIASTQAITESTKATTAKTLMFLGAVQGIGDVVNKLPPGPQQQAAQNGLGVVSNAANQRIDQMNAQTAKQIELNWQLHNKKLNALSPEMAKYDSDRHIPGVPGSTSIPVPQEARDQLNAQTVLDNKGKDLLSYIKQNTGSWDPKTRAVAAQKIEEMKNFYNDSIKGGALTQGRLGWYDEQFAKNPTDILPQMLGSTAKLQEMVRSNAARRDQTLRSYGATVPEQQEQPQTGLSKSKKPIVSKDGGKTWFYQ